MTQLLNVMAVVIDGREIDVHTGAKFNPGGYNRTTVEGQKKIGFTKALVKSTLTFEEMVTSRYSMKDLDQDRMVVQVQCDTGQTYQATMWRTDNPELGEGKASTTLEGEPAEEML